MPGADHEREDTATVPAPVEVTDVTEVETVSDEVERSRTRDLGVVGYLAIIWMLLVVFMTLFPTLMPIPDLTERFREPLAERDFAPRVGHWFGFDQSGRDIFAKVVHGTRASMIVSVGAVLFGLVIGGFFGLISGYFGGRTDSILVNAFNVMLSIPQLVLALTLATVFATGDNVSYAQRVGVVTFAIGIVSIPILGRITRANTLSWSKREFVLASQTIGTKTPRILTLEVLPNVLPAMFSITLLGIAVAVLTEGGLAILGVGVPAEITSPSWGNLIATGQAALLLGEPWQVIGSGLFIFFTVFSLNYLGDVVRARFDVRESAI